MLANLEYCIDPKARDEKGCYITSTEKRFDDIGMDAIMHECHYNPNHPFWVGHFDPTVERNTCIFFAAQHLKYKGIMVTYDAYLCIDNMTNYETVCEFPMFNNHGEAYTQKDYSAIFNNKAQILLPSGKPRPDHFPNLGSYGVADDIGQILKKYRKVIMNSTDEVVLALRPVLRKDQPEQGGWRFHKWGEYVGRHKITHEYLYDEKDIDMVWCFSFILVKKKENV